MLRRGFLFTALISVLISPVVKAGEIKVVSYNIHHGEGLDKKIELERIAEVVLRENPDVVCLQEVDRGMERTGGADFPAIFERLLGMRGVFEANLLRGEGEYGNATFTKHEIVRHENLKLPGPAGVEPRGCLIVTIRIEGREIKIFNTHLGLKPEERLEQAQAIRPRLGEGLQILAGDLNETIAAPGVSVLLEALKNSGPLGEPVSTVTGGSRQIDFILASPTFEVISARVIRDETTAVASDHLPVSVTLRFD